MAVGGRISPFKSVRDGWLVDLRRERGFTRPPWRVLPVVDQVEGFSVAVVRGDVGRGTIPRKRNLFHMLREAEM